MESQEQLSVTHLLGSLVGLGHYGSVHHPLQVYSGPHTAVGNHDKADLLNQAAATTATGPAHCLPHALHSATTLSCGVAFAPQASRPQIQYYCASPEPMLPHSQVRHPPNITTLLLQQANATPPAPCLPTTLQADEDSSLGSREDQGRRGPCAKRGSVRLSRKKCRNSGKAYVSTAGKAVPAKKYQEKDCGCRHECLARLGTAADREAVFRQFWDIGDFERQNVHLAQRVVLVPCSNSRSSSSGRHSDPAQDERRLRTVRRMYFVKLKVSYFLCSYSCLIVFLQD